MVKKILENIKELRNLKGFSQLDMATKLNVDHSTYGYLERGKTDITLSRLEEISNILEIPMVDLIVYPEKASQAIDHGYRAKVVVELELSLEELETLKVRERIFR